MEIFHVLLGGTEHRALRLFDDKSLNLLISASMLTFENRWKKHIDLIHRKKKLLFADSGLLGWIKKGMAWKYATQPDKVLEIQMQIDPDIIATLDHPCEPSILSKSGISLKDALSLTINNSIWLVEKKEAGDNRLKGKKIAIVIQGYEKRDYEYCIKQYENLGFFELDPKEYWFAIGSVCMRRPPELYRITKFVRELVPEKYHVHCFGIANPKWILELKKYGINSVDSATGEIAAGFYAFIDKGGKRRYIGVKRKNKYMLSAMTAFNWARLEMQIREGYEPEYMLFDELEEINVCERRYEKC